MGKASRLHKQAVIAGTEQPIRHEKWKRTPTLIHPSYPELQKETLKPVTAEKLAELKEGAPDVPK